MKLRIWWLIERDYGKGNGGFTYDVESEFEAGMFLNALAEFDMACGVPGNVGGLNIWEDEEWVDYYNDDGIDFDEIMAENEADDPDYYTPTTYGEMQQICRMLARYASDYLFQGC